MTFFLHALTRIPLPILYAIGWFAYLVAFEVLRWRRDLAAANLHGAFPEKDERELARLLRQSYRNLGVLIAEAIHGFGASREEMQDRVRIENPELLVERLQRGQSVVLLTGHFCNWEWLLTGAAAGLGIPIDAVYKPQRVPEIDGFLRRARGRFGGNPIPVKSFLHEVLRRRREPRAYGMVADQTPMGHEDKHWSVFLHRDTAFYTGGGKIARILRAPVLFVGMRRVGKGRYVMRFEVLGEPPYDRSGETMIIERYARALEREIRSSPADWLWVHRKWKYPKPQPAAPATKPRFEERQAQ